MDYFMFLIHSIPPSKKKTDKSVKCYSQKTKTISTKNITLIKHCYITTLYIN